jgi:hypothetical protein
MKNERNNAKFGNTIQEISVLMTSKELKNVMVLYTSGKSQGMGRIKWYRHQNKRGKVLTLKRPFNHT